MRISPINTAVKTADLIRHIFTTEHIGLIKVGKNLKKSIVDTYEFVELTDFDNYDFVKFLDDFLNPGQYIVR